MYELKHTQLVFVLVDTQCEEKASIPSEDNFKIAVLSIIILLFLPPKSLSSCCPAARSVCGLRSQSYAAHLRCRRSTSATVWFYPVGSITIWSESTHLIRINLPFNEFNNRGYHFNYYSNYGIWLRNRPQKEIGISFGQRTKPWLWHLRVCSLYGTKEMYLTSFLFF